PFLEWKLLMRGFMAYYEKDDERATENWQRLDPTRVPARLAAPFRAAIDRTYQAAQPAATQTLLSQQYDQLQGSHSTVTLRSRRVTLSAPERPPRAYGALEPIAPGLRQQVPPLAARLGRVMYWGLLHTGPDDIPRHRRVFGPPPDDRNYHRLQAKAYENG